MHHLLRLDQRLRKGQAARATFATHLTNTVWAFATATAFATNLTNTAWAFAERGA